MKLFCLLFALMLPASAATPAKPARLKFDQVALGNVIRILSARFHAPVTIVARSGSPVSGDFTALGLNAALARAATQAGLEVVSLGASPAAGYLLRPPASGAPISAQPGLGEVRRAILLQQRAALVRAEDDAAPAGR